MMGSDHDRSNDLIRSDRVSSNQDKKTRGSEQEEQDEHKDETLTLVSFVLEDEMEMEVGNRD